MDMLLKLFTILLFVGWRLYWIITEKKADREKPKTQQTLSFFDKRKITKHGLLVVIILIVFQLLFGVSIFPMPNNFAVEVVGFLIVILGVGIAVTARTQLGTNWSNAWEYQIKQKHELITTGIYGYIRHPIYTGVALEVIGAELVAQSYLFLIFFICFFVAYKQAKQEEVLLEQHFGKAYANYKNKTKMLIPFLW